MKNLKEIFDECNEDVTFKIFDSELKITASRNIYKEVNKKYRLLATQSTSKFKTYLNEISNIDEFFASIFDVFLLSLEDGLNEIAKDAISVGIYNYDSETILSECLSSDYFDSFEEIIEFYQEKDDAIISNLSNAARYRDNRKASRSRWHTTTYGGTVFNAWSNQMKVNAMNAVEGLGHSVVNAIGNSIDESNADDARKALFKNENYRLKLIDSVWKSANNLRRFVTNVIRKKCDIAFDGWVTTEAEKEADAIFNNLSKFDLPDSQKKELIIKILDLNPYNKKFYEYSINNFFDNAEDILAISDFFDIKDVNKKIIDTLYSNINKCNNNPEDYIKCREELSVSINKYHISNGEAKEIYSSLENIGLKILNDYAEKNMGDTEESVLLCKKNVEKYRTDMCLNASISDIMNKFSEKLKKIDLELRTVSGVTFNTRDEAKTAKSEVEQNKDVLERENYICLHDYLDQIQKIKQLKIHPSLIAKHISNVNMQKHLFEEKCKKAKRHNYRINHNNNILWDGNTKEMFIRYGILSILFIITGVMAINSKILLTFIGFIITIITFYFLIISRANEAESAWCEVTKKGKYSLLDITNPDKLHDEISEYSSDYKLINSNKAIICLLCISTIIITSLAVVPFFL